MNHEFQDIPLRENGEPKEIQEEVNQVPVTQDNFKSGMASRGFEVSSQNERLITILISPISDSKSDKTKEKPCYLSWK